MKTLNQSQEKVILDSFLEVVQAPYGDFAAIGKLSDAINNPDTLQKIVTFLSQTPQGKQAFIDFPLLGKIDLQQLHQLPNHTFFTLGKLTIFGTSLQVATQINQERLN